MNDDAAEDRTAASQRMVFAGHARLPQSVAPIQGSQVIALELEAERRQGRITDASVVGVPPLAASLLRHLLIGRDLNEGAEPVVREIQRRYVGVIQRAATAAVNNAFETYLAYVRDRGGPDGG